MDASFPRAYGAVVCSATIRTSPEDFFVEEIAPAIYNLAIADAQERLHARVAELDIECHEEPFEYWKKQPGRKR